MLLFSALPLAFSGQSFASAFPDTWRPSNLILEEALAMSRRSSALRSTPVTLTTI
jgi:hypothetical protein